MPVSATETAAPFDLPALIREVDALWDPETNLMTHNERVLILLCQRLAAPLRAIVDTRAGTALSKRLLDQSTASAPAWKPAVTVTLQGSEYLMVLAGLRALSASARGPAPFQDRVLAQMCEICADDPTDLEERRDRHAEEDAELLQSLGLSREAHHRIVDYVHDRPVGDPGQELGGTMHTLAGLAALACLDMVACGEVEFDRVGRPEITAKIRRKRANRHGRGPLPGDDADLVTASAARAAG